MPRANRHYIPGYVWHITHRCHKKEFLLKFARDRRRWLQWLFEAKKRYGISVLNYMLTSNHIHLLVADDGDRDVIPNSIQLIAGRTGQEYNQRKKRKGAFWEDRYHATAIERGEHLIRCMLYIDMNMVRAGAVNHPRQWPFCGYKEIESPGQRYAIIDYKRLVDLLHMRDCDELQESYSHWVDEILRAENHTRESKCTESIAVGSKRFVETTKRRLGIKARGRHVLGKNGRYELREPPAPYNGHFAPENAILSLENTYFWNDSI
jgi:putative transposase